MMAVYQLKFGQPQQVARMVDVLGGTLAGYLKRASMALLRRGRQASSEASRCGNAPDGCRSARIVRKFGTLSEAGAVVHGGLGPPTSPPPPVGGVGVGVGQAWAPA